MFWGGPGLVLEQKKWTYINFQKIDIVAIGGSCAVFYDEFAHLVLVEKYFLRKISVPGGMS